MANEITSALSLEFTKDSKTAKFTKSGMTLDMAGGDFFHGTQGVATSPEALDIGHITSPGMCAMYNHDATNFVEVRGASGEDDGLKVPPKQGVLFHFPHGCTAPFVTANTLACEIEYLLIEA